MRAFAVLAALALSGPLAARGEDAAAEEKGPLLTADLFYVTRDLLSDVYGHAVGPAGKKFHQQFKAWREKQGIQSHNLSELDVLGLVETKTGGKVKKEQVMKALGAAKAHKDVVQDKVTSVLGPIASKSYEKLDEKAVQFVDAMEEFLPAYKGKVPKTLLDVAVFLFSTLSVLYVLVRLALLGVRMAFRILCCPCRMCRGGKKVEAKGSKKKGKAAASQPAAKPAATKTESKKKR